MQRTSKNTVFVLFVLAIMCMFALSGCGKASTPKANAAEQVPATPISVNADTWMTWDENIAPNYVLVTGEAEIDFVPAAGEIVYGGLDDLGRTTYAVGNITKEQRDAGSANGHDNFAAGDDPSGWPSVNPEVEIITPTGKAYHGYLWNRSHMIADSLGGDAIKCNAVTGTRMQNVGANNGDNAGGMAFCEVKARKWLDAHPDGTLYYRADAMYVGSELIPRAVIVNMKSSDGELNMQVIVYNAAKGFEIDYNNAANTTQNVNDGIAIATVEADNAATEDVHDAAVTDTVYVTNSGKKYHIDANCKGLANAKEIIPETLSDAQAKGLEPCGICAHE